MTDKTPKEIKPFGRRPMPDDDQLAAAIASVIERAPRTKSPWLPVIGAVLTLITAAGAGNWAVMSTGDAETQAIVRAELRAYGDRMELRFKDQLDERDAASTERRDELQNKMTGLELQIRELALDIREIKTRQGIRRAK